MPKAVSGLKSNASVTTTPIPYSPALVRHDFWLFPKSISALKGTRFESHEAVRTKSTEMLKALQ